MSLRTLEADIQTRAAELLGDRLIALSMQEHKRGWRGCPCSWCAKKREATVVIGSHAPARPGYYVGDLRDAWREEKRQQYRAALRALET